MAEVIGTIGGEQVELNNAASEETLKLLLASLKTLNKSVVNLGTSGGLNFKDVQDDLEDFTQGTSKATGIMGMLGGALGSVLGLIGGLVGAAVELTAGLAKFTFSLINGEGSLSGFYASLKNLPGPLGWVAGLFEQLAKLQEQELENYRDMSKAGINFGGDLTAIRKNALDLGLTLDEFGVILKKNSVLFANMGSTVNQGAEAFTRLAIDFRNSEVGAEIRALGYNSQEATQSLANYIAMTGGRTKEELKNTKALTASAANYMFELDALAAITGKSRKDQEDALTKLSMQAAWENYIAKLRLTDPEAADKALQGLAEASTRGGEKMAQNFQAYSMGYPPMTAANARFAGQLQNADAATRQLVAATKDGSKSLNDIKLAGAGLTYSLTKDAEMYDGTAQAISLMGEAGENMDVALRAQTQSLNKNMVTLKDHEALVGKTTKDQKDRESSLAAMAAESEKGFKDLGAAIYGMLQPAIKVLVPIINEIAMKFTSLVKDNLPAISAGLKYLGEKTMEFVDNLFSDAGRDKIINDLKYFFQLALIEIKSALIPWYTKAHADEDRQLLEDQKKLTDIKTEAAKSLEQITAESTEAEKLAYQKKADMLFNQAVQLEKKLQVATDPMKNFGPAYARDAQGKNQFERNREQPAAGSQPPVSRATGSLGATGKLFEDFGSGTKAVLHGKEAVVTPEQMNQIISATSNTAKGPTSVNVNNTDENNLSDHLQRLNTLTTEMLKVMKEASENMKRNVDATKALNRNLF